MEFVLGKENEIYKLGSLSLEKIDNDIITRSMNDLSYKEKLMKAKSLVLVERKNSKVIFQLNLIQNQHFYPLSILDYANIMKKYINKEIDNLPIMSLDSHDYNFCDFHCKDCLAVDTREWARKNILIKK